MWLCSQHRPAISNNVQIPKTHQRYHQGNLVKLLRPSRSTRSRQSLESRCFMNYHTPLTTFCSSPLFAFLFFNDTLQRCICFLHWSVVFRATYLYRDGIFCLLVGVLVRGLSPSTKRPNSLLELSDRFRHTCHGCDAPSWTCREVIITRSIAVCGTDNGPS